MGLNAEQVVMAAFADVGFESGAEFFIPSSFAVQFLKECHRVRLAVVGIEGFKRLGDNVRPHMELVADFSSLFEATQDWSATLERSHTEARAFLAANNFAGDVWWNFVLLEESEVSWPRELC